MINKLSNLVAKLILILLITFIIGLFISGTKYILTLFLIVLFSFVVMVIFMLLFDKDDEKIGESRSSSKSYLFEESIFDRIRAKYEKIAENYKEERQYKKAANVYLKLLNDPYSAAATLKDGKFYEEAAYLYLKRLDNKELAADCFLELKNYKKALELYKQIEDWNKVGDILLKIGQKDEANLYYTKHLEQLLNHYNYLEAYHFVLEKFNDNIKADQILLDCWYKDLYQKEECLKIYLSKIDEKDYSKEIEQIYDKTSIFRHIEYLDYLIILHKSIADDSKKINFINFLKRCVIKTPEPNYFKYLKIIYPNDIQLKLEITQFNLRKII